MRKIIDVYACKKCDVYFVGSIKNNEFISMDQNYTNINVNCLKNIFKGIIFKDGRHKILRKDYVFARLKRFLYWVSMDFNVRK